MAPAAVSSNVVVLILWINCLSLLPLGRFCVWSLFCNAVHCAGLVCNRLSGNERAGCFISIVFLLLCDCQCFVSLPSGAVYWWSMSVSFPGPTITMPS